MDNEKYIKVRDAFLDVLDGNSWPDEIQYITGLDDERCKEISNLFTELTDEVNSE